MLDHHTLILVFRHFSLIINKTLQVDINILDCNTCKRVPHDKLFETFLQIALPPFIVGWVTAYLKNHKKYVDINKSTSDALPVTSGLPQGSVLRPLLCLVFLQWHC